LTLPEPSLKPRRRSEKEKGPLVEIEGPLGAYLIGPKGFFDERIGLTEDCIGKLHMDLPPFVVIDYDETVRKAVISVQDSEIRAQRELWGEFFKPSRS
jgi:hypothetical protein